MKILITNDDGIQAPGLKFLYQALLPIADVYVVAPAHEQSACSLSTTFKAPLDVKPVKWEEGGHAWSVTGTPVDCVKLGMGQLMPCKPDLVVSGINPGTNAGRNALFSGTVAAAVEAVMQGVPGIALSTLSMENPSYASFVPHIKKIINYIVENPLPAGTLLNVNFPDVIKGLKMTHQGCRVHLENPTKRTHPIGEHSYYWLGRKEVRTQVYEDVDTWWLFEGYITAVPVHVTELTHQSYVTSQKQSFENLLD